jgi:hypothetical protein
MQKRAKQMCSANLLFLCNLAHGGPFRLEGFSSLPCLPETLFLFFYYSLILKLGYICCTGGFTVKIPNRFIWYIG